MTDLFRCACESGGACTQVSACRANAAAERLRAERDHLASQYDATCRAENEHCKDCCCAQSWRALGINEYTGRSIPEEIERLRAELAKLQRAIGDTPDSWAALVRDAAIGRWLLSQAEDYDGHACFPDVPYRCPDLRESVEEAMKEQQP